MARDKQSSGIRRAFVHVLLALLAAGLVLAGEAQAAERKIAVREQLNQTYGRELVSFPFAAPDKQCIEESIQVAGPGGPVPAQLSEVQYHAGGKRFVKSARLWFIVEGLKPLETQQYTVSWSAKKAAAPASDLKVAQKKGSVEISSAAVGVRLPVGKGEGPKGVPAPLLGMRLGQGAWSKAGDWTGKAKVAQWSSELVEAGPVFALVVSTYTLADGIKASFRATVIQGDTAVRWQMAVEGDQPEALVRFRLPAVPGVEQVVSPLGYGQWARERKQPLKAPAENFGALSPNSSLVNIFAENPNRVILVGKGATLELASRDPAAWVEPGEPQTYAGADHWDLDMIPQMWEAWKRKGMPMSYLADGTVTLSAGLASGQRKWSVSAGAPAVGERLDEINRMVLDWPAKTKHPCVFVDAQHVRAVRQRAAEDQQLAARLNGRWAASAVAVTEKPADQRTEKEVKKVVNALRVQLAKMGKFDVMRGAIATVSLYDALIDSDLLTAEERKLFRAQMAYLAYLMADPMCWSTERGYGSGNPNMHCSYTLSLGVIACTLRDHPMAKQWSDYATAWMNEWLDDEVGSNGEWLCEGSHYGMVSLEPQISYAIAAKRAGYHDFTNDPRLKKMILYFAKMNTPPDVQRGGHRVSGAYGRGTSSDRLAFCGVTAQMTAEADPDYAKVMQWMWAQMGYPGNVGDYRLGGYEPYCMDTRLPMEAPKWDSELFPQLGALLRAGFGTPHESYVNVLAGVDSLRNLDVWVPGVGGISQWFGRGKPLSTCFTIDTGYKVRHDFLKEGVRLARNYAPGDALTPFGYYSKTHFGTFAALPQADYVRTRIVNTHPDERNWPPPNLPAYPRVTPAKSSKLDWTRQVLFLKDADPAGPAYLVLRDTTRGGEPSAWQFWTLSEKIGTPQEARDADAFLADKPGETILPARKLAQSNRYTALGQFGMDIEYFIAAPSATPRHTLRYGGEYRRVPEYQDLLHLELPGDGAYFVAIYPRPRAEAAPEFTCLADGKIIKVAGGFGTDYAFLAPDKTNAAAGDVSFEGTAASVQQRKDTTHLGLGAAGQVRAGEYAVSAPFAADLAVAGNAMTLVVPASGPGGELTLTAPGRWQPGKAAGVEVKAVEGGLRVTVPKGAVRVVFTKGR